MKNYLLTIYTIKTQISWITADNLESAQKLVADQDESIHWMEIPTFNFLSWCEDGKGVGPNLKQALENFPSPD